MYRPYSKDPQVEKSLRHSVKDGVAFSVMAGCGETYFSAFALHLKASTAQIGLLASLPPLIGSLAQLLSAWLGRVTQQRKRVMLTGVYLQVFMWLPIMLLPLLFPEWAIPLLIVSITLYFAAGHLAATQWNSLMGDLVPERKRGRFFARRNRLANVAAFIAVIGAGLTLQAFTERGHTTLGFVVVFGIAGLARVVSAYQLRCMQDPDHGKVAALEWPLRRELWQRLRRSDNARFSLTYALMIFMVYIASPFFSVYVLRDLHYSYVEFMATTAEVVLLQFLTLNMWGRVSDLFGNRAVMLLTGALIPTLPLLWLFSSNFYYILGAQSVSGLLWAGFSLSATNYLYDMTPPAKRVTYMAMHSVVGNTGLFAGALLGGYLGTHLPTTFTLGGEDYAWLTPLYGVFLLSFIGRAAVAWWLLPRFREHREVRPISMGRLIFRVTGMHALSGLLFEVTGRGGRDKGDGA